MPELTREEKENRKNTVYCSNCDFDYFEDVHAERFERSASVLLGQGLPVKRGSQGAFRFLRCLRCGTLHEPRLNLSGPNVYRRQYDKLFEEMGNKLVPIK